MRRFVLLPALLALVGSTVASVDAGAASPRARAMKMRLKPFTSCQRLVKYARHNVKRELRYAGGPALPPGAPPPFESGGSQGAEDGAGGDGTGSTAGPDSAPTPSTPEPGDSSQTNVQEAGVDEPDFVKFDGTHLFALTGNHLSAVDARAATPKLLGSLELGEQWGGQLLLHGKRLLVFSYAGSSVEPMPGVVAGVAYFYRPATLITEVDVSDPADMRIVRTETVDGTYVSARLNGSTVRVVLTTPPVALDYGQAGAPLPAQARRWVPRARLENKVTGTTR